jgi:hypothetical protein
MIMPHQKLTIRNTQVSNKCEAPPKMARSLPSKRDIGPGLIFSGLCLLAMVLGAAAVLLIIFTAGAFLISALLGQGY